MQKNRLEFVKYAVVSAGLLVVAYTALWAVGGFNELGYHATIAAIIGIALTSILAIGLMGLVFFSQNSGHDADVNDMTKSDHDRDRH